MFGSHLAEAVVTVAEDWDFAVLLYVSSGLLQAAGSHTDIRHPALAAERPCGQLSLGGREA